MHVGLGRLEGLPVRADEPLGRELRHQHGIARRGVLAARHQEHAGARPGEQQRLGLQLQFAPQCGPVGDEVDLAAEQAELAVGAHRAHAAKGRRQHRPGATLERGAPDLAQVGLQVDEAQEDEHPRVLRALLQVEEVLALQLVHHAPVRRDREHENRQQRAAHEEQQDAPAQTAAEKDGPPRIAPHQKFTPRPT